MQGKKPKVVFTFVEAGMGHVIPMDGAYQAFVNKYGDKCQVIKSYIFSDSPNEAVQKIGEEIANHSKRAMSNWLYNRFEAFSYALGSGITHFFLDAHFRKSRKAFFKEFEELNPDLIVSSYYKPSHLAYQSNKKGLTDTLIVTYTPDTYVYPAWNKNCDLFLVNNNRAGDRAIKKGFKPQTIKQIPFIFSKAVTEQVRDKEQARANLGIDKDFTVLFTAGAYGAKKIEKLFYKLAEQDLSINLVVVCGKNKQMLDYVNSVKEKGYKNTKIHSVGFTDKLAEYMTACDLMVGKSGMNTLMEALYLGCPVLVHAEINRLEQLTSKDFAKDGLIMREMNLKRAIELIKKCANDCMILDEYKEKYATFTDSSGAEQAADSIFELLKTRFPEL